ncbi:hypothetical protein PHYC_01050 [Phycisphaerales bacterium]|nr:hypothetical protein PHYC_01050 [Phycisphaerales bacterium]
MRCWLFIAVSLFGSAYSTADVVTYTRPFDEPLTIGGPLNVALPRFDIPGATLTGVQLTVHLGPSAHVLIENRMSQEGTFAGSFRGVARFSAPGGAQAQSDQFLQLLDPVLLAADDGVNWTGPDCLNLGRVILERDLTAEPGEISPFVGVGDFDARVEVTAMFVECTTGMVFESDISVHRISGQASVSYTYVPGAWTAAGLAGLAFTPRPRRVR